MKATTLVIDEHRETCGLLADNLWATGHGSREDIPHLTKAQSLPPERGSLLGASPAMLAIFALMRRIAGADTTVLLSGASGTGKGLVARALHEQSLRGFGPFVAVNCAAGPVELERALFGRARGAFADADSGRASLFERAGAGTLLLDDIGEIPLDMQPELLRALEQCQTHPAGGSAGVGRRARIIAATTRNLEGEVEAKRFREDLFERLNEVHIGLPSLRARGADVLLLADHFVRGFAARSGKTVSGISSEAQRKLLGFDWPGNVRQLESSMEHAVARMRAERVEVEDLPERVVQFDRACHTVDRREHHRGEAPTARPPVSGRRPPAGSLSRAANRRGYPCFRSPVRRKRTRRAQDL